MERQTQTETYWQQLTLTEDDIDRIYNVLINATEPVPLFDLARVVVESRVQEEERRLREVLSRGKVYRPRDDYDVGDVLVFPALDYAVGTVVGKRSGRNPAYPDFSVIQVQMEGEETTREFAARLQAPHRLNENGEADLSHLNQGMSPAQILEQYEDTILSVVERELREHDEFIFLEGGWFLRDSLAEINLGHLNIADAAIDLEGRPLTLDEILPLLELPEEIPLDIQRLSLKHAIRQDERFVSVTADGEERWYLRRLLPPALAERPRLLHYDPIPYRRDALTLSLLQMEWELDDEWSSQEQPAEDASAALLPSAICVLIYPHWRYGTLPLTQRIRALMPHFETDLYRVTLVDGRWGERYTGWVAARERFIAGLEEWYRKHKIPVGAYITLERKADEPDTFIIDFRPKRMKREWVRVASVGKEGITFEMRKVEVACETDEHVLLAALETEPLDEFVNNLPDPLPPIQETVAQIFPELAKLDPKGTVHAKTLYSAVNVIRRTPPGPVFAVLAGSDRYKDMGDGFWAEELGG